MVLNVYRIHQVYMGREEGREGRMEVGEEGDYIYLSLHCHHQNDPCIKMGSDESSFNVSLIARDKIRSQCPQTTNFEKRRSRSEVPLLVSLMPCRR